MQVLERKTNRISDNTFSRIQRDAVKAGAVNVAGPRVVG